MNPLLEENVLFQGVRFQIIEKKYQGKNGAYIRDYVDVSPAAVILPITENNEIIFIKQLREVIEEESLELPAGIIEKGEEPIQAAKRELEEETGYIAHTLHPLAQFYPSCGYSNEKIYIFLAKDLTPSTPHYDKDEQITQIVKIPYEKCLELAKAGTFKHASVNVALFQYFLKNSDIKSQD